MISVALIGLDGAGKTTVAEALVQDLPYKTGRVYMGTNLESSNVLLPTSRLLRFIRRRRLVAQLGGVEGKQEAQRQLASNRFRRKPAGTFRAALRLAQRLAECTYRSAYVRASTRAGTVVVCDRHLYYENLSRNSPEARRTRGWPDRVLFWYSDHLLPRPDLVILLDVPGEVAHRRKPELSVEEFEDRRKALKACSKRDSRIAVIDATAPLESVVRQTTDVIRDFVDGRRESPLSGEIKHA